MGGFWSDKKTDRDEIDGIASQNDAADSGWQSWVYKCHWRCKRACDGLLSPWRPGRLVVSPAESVSLLCPCISTVTTPITAPRKRDATQLGPAFIYWIGVPGCHNTVCDRSAPLDPRFHSHLHAHRLLLYTRYHYFITTACVADLTGDGFGARLNL